SASVTGFPSPGRSAAIVVAEPRISARGRPKDKLLLIDMLGLPLFVDAPTRNGIHVTHREGRNRRIDLGFAALGQKLGAGRLHVASLVPRAALQHGGVGGPAPGETAPGASCSHPRA